MSRYSFKTTVDDKTLEVAYGYDRPLQEYFIQVFNYEISDEDCDACILWEGSRMTGKSNSAMIYLYEKYKVPEEHIRQVALDLPF